MRRTVVAVVVVLALLGGGAAWYLAPIGPIATGYAAQIGCGLHVVADRPVDDTVPELPSNPLVPLLRVSADGPRVTATLLGAYGSTATRTEDGGCRLGDPADVPAATDDQLLERAAPTADDLVVPTDVENEAANAGFDVAALGSAVTGAFAEDADPDTTVGTRAVVVVHRGTVVAERYAEGFDADTPLLGWSMTKSVANAVAGTLVGEGALALDDDALWDGWGADDERSSITLRQLLTMTDGLAFDEVYDPDTDATRMLFTPRDAAAYAADQPLAHEPGTHWEYSSGTTNVLCDVLARADGGNPATLLTRRVFEPLAMTSAVVGTDATGLPVCSSFGYATARDWARFGLLYEQDGVWGGEQLLPPGWVELSATPVALETEQPYGAQWWLNTDAGGRVRMPDAPDDAFWASGNEGQQVVVLPSHDLVVVRLGLSRGFDGVDWGLEPLLAGVVEAAPGGPSTDGDDGDDGQDG